ncbi:transport and golgi organization 1 isoform X3 [Oratosquilla oratoria]|uniref:transport and golgi organization 1 isoform X3 n=1 Tax=Oratosquilla oratoria TaxID=337810 RepID=UPI003F762C12
MALTWSRHTILVLSISLLVSFVFADLSGTRLCGDPMCKEPVSRGKTVLQYISPDADILSFPNNADVLIYSKDSGDNKDLWGVQIRGKRGYAPKKFIRELKILKRNPSYVVPTDNSKSGQDADKGTLPTPEVPPSTPGVPPSNSDQVAPSAEDLELQRVNQDASKEPPVPPDSDELTPGSDAVPSGGDEVPSGGEPEASQIVPEEQVEPVSGREETTAEGVEEPVGNEREEMNEEEVVPEESTIEVQEAHHEGSVDSSSPETVLEPMEAEKVKEITTDATQPVVNTQDTAKGNAEETSVNAPETGGGQHAGQSEASPVSNSGMNTEATESSKNKIISPTQPQYEIIDGTTIYTGDDVAMYTPSEEPYPPSVGLPEATTTVSPMTEPYPSFGDTTEGVTSGPSHEATETLSDAVASEVINPKDSVASEVINPQDPVASEVINSQDSVASEVINPQDSVASEVKNPQESAQVNPTSAEGGSGWLSSLTMSLPSWLSKEEVEGNPEHNLEMKDGHEIIDDGNNDEGFEEGEEEEEEEEEEEYEEENEDEEEKESVAEVKESVAEVKEGGAEEKGKKVLAPPQVTPEEEHVANEIEHEELGSLLSEADLEARYHAEPAAGEGGLFSSWFSPAEASETSTLPNIYKSIPEEEGEMNMDKVPASVIGRPASDSKEKEDSNRKTTSENPESHKEEDARHTEASEPNAQGGLDPVSRHPKGMYKHKPEVDAPVDSHDHTHSALNPTPHDAIPTSSALYRIPESESRSEPDPAASIIDSVQNDIPTVTADDRVEEEDLPPQEFDTEEESFLAQAEEQFWELTAGLKQLGEGLTLGLEASEIPKIQVSSGIVVFLGMCGLTIVAIYFTHLMLVKMSREGPLLAALNKKDRSYRLVQAENLALQEELKRTKQQLDSVETRVQSSAGDVCDISSELEKVKEEYTAERSKLEDKITLLELELEESTTNGLEMHKMLSELLSSQKDASAFQTSVDSLQTMLDSQREKVESLTSDLFMKSRLNEELQMELSSTKERISKLDYQVDQLTRSLEEVTETKTEAVRQLRQEEHKLEVLQEANLELSQQFGHKGSRVGELETELESMKETLSQLRETVETKESELMVAKECLKQLRITSDDDQSAPDEEKLNALFDVIRVKAELKKVLESRKQLEDQLRDTETAQYNLEDTMESIRKEVVQLRGQHDMAVEEKEEAQKKLQVLTDYFKEKEAQLTKELESQEGLRLGAEGSATAIAARIETYQQEISTYKSKVESLRKELEEQENSYKSQVTAQEQKAHESWLQTRTAERKQEELRQENNQLRNRLALMQKEREDVQQQHSIIKPVPKRVDANGTLSSPGPAMNGPNEDSGPLPLPRDLDSPPMPPHPLHPPPHPMLPHPMFPGGLPPPHQPGMPPPLPPFLPGEPPFMGHLPPPPPSDRRPPPAGGMASPPFGRSTSPPYDYRRSPPIYERRSDRFSPSSDRSHMSDRRFTPPPYRRRPSPDHHSDPRMRSPGRRSDRIRSPDHRSDRMRSPDRRSDRSRRSPARCSPDRIDRRSPDRRSNRRSPDRRSNRSPDGYPRARSPGRRYYDESDYNHDDHRPRPHSGKAKKKMANGVAPVVTFKAPTTAEPETGTSCFLPSPVLPRLQP